MGRMMEDAGAAPAHNAVEQGERSLLALSGIVPLIGILAPGLQNPGLLVLSWSRIPNKLVWCDRDNSLQVTISGSVVEPRTHPLGSIWVTTCLRNMGAFCCDVTQIILLFRWVHGGLKESHQLMTCHRCS